MNDGRLQYLASFLPVNLFKHSAEVLFSTPSCLQTIIKGTSGEASWFTEAEVWIVDVTS